MPSYEKGDVPDDWKEAIIVPLYKGNGSRSDCSSYRGISLLSVPGKVYGRILTERLMEVTDGKVSEEQGDFRKGRGCINQIFAMKRLVEEYLEKDKSCTQLLWISRRHTIGLTKKLYGMCCISMVWVDSY